MKKLLFSSCLMLAAMTAVVQAQEPAKETPKSTLEAAQAEAKKALAEAKERAIEAAKAAAAAAVEAGKTAEGAASGEKKVEVQIKATGKVVKVGPDGKVEVIDLEGGDGKNLIPAEAKEHIQLMLKKVHDAGDHEAGKDAIEGTHKVESNVIVSDGKVTGKIVIVGPDGKPQVKEFNLSGTGVDGGAMKAVQEILKSNTQLPAEAAKQLESVFRSTIGDGERRVLAIGGGAKTAEQLEAVSAKLDKILSRLDALEKEISELKASK